MKIIKIISGLYLMIFGVVGSLYLFQNYIALVKFFPKYVLNWTAIGLLWVIPLGFLLISETIRRK